MFFKHRMCSPLISLDVREVHRWIDLYLHLLGTNRQRKEEESEESNDYTCAESGAHNWPGFIESVPLGCGDNRICSIFSEFKAVPRHLSVPAKNFTPPGL